MHFEILVEDLSGKKALDILVPKIIDDSHSFTVHPYKGIGRIPRNMRDADDAGKRILLDNLPKLLKGYGRAFASYQNFLAAVILVCDLDDKCQKKFREQLSRITNPQVSVIFVKKSENWPRCHDSALLVLQALTMVNSARLSKSRRFGGKRPAATP